MTWETLIRLVLLEGLPVAARLWQLWTTNAPPTTEDWKQLEELGKSSARQRMLEALARAGIDPSSDKGKAFLDLTPI